MHHIQVAAALDRIACYPFGSMQYDNLMDRRSTSLTEFVNSQTRILALHGIKIVGAQADGILEMGSILHYARKQSRTKRRPKTN